MLQKDPIGNNGNRDPDKWFDTGIAIALILVVIVIVLLFLKEGGIHLH